MKELEQLETKIKELEGRLNKLDVSDRLIFYKLTQILDGRHVQLGLSTGTKIGTATTQKLGFFNKSPVVQRSAIGAPSSPGATYSQSEAQSAVTAINSIRTALSDLGLTA